MTPEDIEKLRLSASNGCQFALNMLESHGIPLKEPSRLQRIINSIPADLGGKVFTTVKAGDGKYDPCTKTITPEAKEKLMAIFGE